MSRGNLASPALLQNSTGATRLVNQLRRVHGEHPALLRRTGSWQDYHREARDESRSKPVIAMFATTDPAALDGIG
jgi:hypothetical protein